VIVFYAFLPIFEAFEGARAPGYLGGNFLRAIIFYKPYNVILLTLLDYR
jgi:hypothetical protein